MKPTGSFALFIAIFSVPLFVCVAKADEQMLTIITPRETIEGRLAGHGSTTCWIMTREGKLNSVPIAEVTSFHVHDSSFQPFTAVKLRSQLRREFGRDYEIKGTSEYLVVAAEGRANDYADLFDQLYRDFHRYFSVRDVSLKKPEFPLIAIVFHDYDQFRAYAEAEGMTVARGLNGYYSRRTNRVALYERDSSHAEADPKMPLPRHGLGKVGEDAGTRETMIHEATHQVAFNVGLHSRLGQTPTWVVEGLATVFEHPDMRGAAQGGSPMNRVNRERYVWFGNYVKERRQESDFTKLIASDLAFRSNVLDAYSQAWALTFFLMETRSQQYAEYLKTIMRRDPLKAYSQAERMKDFESCFDSDLKSLETDFYRFFADL